jgi:class 3 adenylate cyclase
MLQLLNRRPDLKTAAARLDREGIAADLRVKFANYLEKAQPREVFHVNPRYLAERLNLSEREALRLLVLALYAGLITLHWDVRCPACGSYNDNDSLHELHRETQCVMCQLRFAPKLDDEVRVTFSVHPRFRSLYADANDKQFRSEVDERLGPTPGRALLVLPDFQRLFPQERLLPDESLEVARMALLFTDLAGSTALYAQRGDPRAYHLVRLHFGELFNAADRNSGTVVKNIGDAVMAAFQTPAEALAAALAMQADIAVLNRRERLAGDEALILKVGLHSGPCLNVTLNDRPDYFGTTVNIAARVQGLSRGGDVVFTDAIRHDAEAMALIHHQPLETTQTKLKGIEGDLTVHRLVMVHS